MLGATSYAIAGTDALRVVTDWQIEEADATDRLDRLVPRLMSFLLGGLRAPCPSFPMPRLSAISSQKHKTLKGDSNARRSLCWASPSWFWPGCSPSGRCAGR
jgi:hypothetical protein